MQRNSPEGSTRRRANSVTSRQGDTLCDISVETYLLTYSTIQQRDERTRGNSQDSVLEPIRASGMCTVSHETRLF